MKNAEDLIYELYKYYKVDNNILLAEKLNTAQQTVSNWKSRNSISAIKKKCKELGIYKEIFKETSPNSFHKASSHKMELYEELTTSLINKCIGKYGGEENFQYELMDLLKNIK